MHDCAVTLITEHGAAVVMGVSIFVLLVTGVALAIVFD